MPWPVKTLLTMRQEFVSLANLEGANIRELCRRFEISPTVAYKWLQRYRQEGLSGLANRSRRPRYSPRQTPSTVEGLVVGLRREHPAWGARKLRRRLQDLGHRELPATSTITDILHRHGLILPESSQAAQPFQRFERAAPNQLWQVDFKGHFALGSGRCHPLCALDDHSRYNVLLAACADQQGTTVQAQLTGAFRRHGLPDGVLWDNGSPWGATGDEYTGLDVWLMRLGVGVHHGRAYHPQTQGKEERFHRTLQVEVLQRGGWQDCPQVQAAFDRWRPIYNTQRPHDALDLQTPLSRYQPSQRSYPETLPPVEYDHQVEVCRVNVAGRISYQNRQWPVGRAFHGEWVGVRPGAYDGQFKIIFMNRVIRELNLNQNPTP
jgi:transposase InsO family protein